MPFNLYLARIRADVAALRACNGDVDAINRYYASRRTPEQQARYETYDAAWRAIGRVIKLPLMLALFVCIMAGILLLNVGAWMIHPILGFIVTICTMARIAAGE